MGRGAWWATVHGVTKESDKTAEINNRNNNKNNKSLKGAICISFC